MDPEVILIARPQVDFSNLLRVGKMALGRSLSQGLDSVNEPAGSLASFVCVLDELATSSSDVRNSLVRAGALLRHLSFSFMAVVSDELYVELLRESGLNFVANQSVRRDFQFAVVSGNCEQWRTAVINLATGRESYEARLFMDKVYRAFTQLGLGLLWADFRKEGLGDTTFRLLPAP